MSNIAIFLIIKQYCWKCQWLSRNIVGNIASNFVESTLFLTILQAMLPAMLLTNNIDSSNAGNIADNISSNTMAILPAILQHFPPSSSSLVSSLGHMTRDTWPLTPDTWHVTPDDWYIFFCICHYPHTLRDLLSPLCRIFAKLQISTKAKQTVQQKKSGWLYFLGVVRCLLVFCCSSQRAITASSNIIHAITSLLQTRRDQTRPDH